MSHPLGFFLSFSILGTLMYGVLLILESSSECSGVFTSHSASLAASYIALGVPFFGLFIFYNLRRIKSYSYSKNRRFQNADYGRTKIDACTEGVCSSILSVLAVGTIMGASASEEDAENGGSADQAGLAGAHINAVFELEEAADAIGVYIIGDGGAAEFDGVREDVLQGDAEAI